jgi:threonine synthase
MARLTCRQCDHVPAPLDWRCVACGAPLELSDEPPFDPALIRREDWTMWRYGALLPVERRVTLGAGGTPLIESEADGLPVWAKLDYANPTGSYKDRGTETMMSYLLGHGVGQVVEDSSGNAGASVAMYAGAAGVRAQIYAPAAAPLGKKRAIAAAAELVEVAGARAEVTAACLRAVEAGAAYATHAWSPFFIAGQQTLAWELWEQLGTAPEAVVMPAGQGLLLLGVARGFRALHAAGCIERLPRLYAVQSAACDPFVRGFEAGLPAPVPVTPAPTQADGVVIGQQVRGAQVLAAIRESGGAALRVAEPELLAAHHALARRGLFAEPTSALTWAALPQVRQHLGVGHGGAIVTVLTGHGLKAVMG